MAKIQITTEDLLSVPQVAKILGRPKITLYRWIEKNKVEAIEIGGVLFIQKREVDRLTKEETLVQKLVK